MDSFVTSDGTVWFVAADEDATEWSADQTRLARAVDAALRAAVVTLAFADVTIAFYFLGGA